MLQGKRTLLAAALAAILTSPLSAQIKIQVQPAQPGQPVQAFRIAIGGGGQKLSLVLFNKAAQEDLKITPEQLKKLQDLQKKNQEAMKQARQLPRQQWAKKFQEIREQIDKDVDKVITKEQAKRIDQIQFQQRSRYSIVNAVLVPPFDKKIGITDDQKTRIQQMQKDQSQAIRNLPRNLPAQQRRKAVEDIRKETDKKIQADVLTKEQKDKIKELTGKPFDFKQPNIRPIPGGAIPIRPGKIQIKPINGKKIQVKPIQINGKKIRIQVLPVEPKKKK